MAPKVYADIVARDKTEAGRKSAERGFQGFAKRTAIAGERSGLGKLGKQVEGLAKFRGLSLGFDSAGRSLSSIGRISGDVSAGVGNATARMLSFGAAGESALGVVAEGAGVAAAAIAGTAAAVVGLAAATYALGDKWAKTGAEVDRTARTIGVTAAELQTARAVGERFGVTVDGVNSSVEGLANTLYDAKYGANNLALGALNQLGVKLKQTKDGAVDVNQAMLDIADAIARQKDPGVQRKLAAVFGMSAMLPALRQGSAALKREGKDYTGSGAMLSDAEVARSVDVNRKTVTVRQHLGAIEKTAGVAAEQVTGAATDAVLTPAGLKGFADRAHTVIDQGVSVLSEGAKGLAHSGVQAGRELEQGARRAGKLLGIAYDGFAYRIEHQESGGRQFDRRGRPLTSSAGAVGVRQLLPETAKRAAEYGGIPWDLQRFRTDASYNRQLGDIELKRLLAKFGGDQVLAAAAYNAGEGRLTGYNRGGVHHKGWLETIGDPRKGEISDEDFAARIPFKETREYVANTAIPGSAELARQVAPAPTPTQAAQAAPARAQVEIVLKNAPPGTIARATGGRDVDLNVQVKRSMEGA